MLLEFQRLYTPSAFREERALWRSVIYLNLARSVRIILDTITHVLRGRASRVDSGGDDIDSDPDNGDQLGPLDGLRALVARLEPVRRVEAALAARLVPSDEEEPTHLGVDELFVRPGAGWKGLVARGARAFGSESNGRPSSKGTGYASTVATNGGDEAAARLYACLEDMLALWAHPTTREILKRRKVKIEESPGLCVWLSFACFALDSLS
jgi:guanine nucleotide-binding protein alpha-1 subunit